MDGNCPNCNSRYYEQTDNVKHLFAGQKYYKVKCSECGNEYNKIIKNNDTRLNVQVEDLY
ncbi:MAG: hypothetical protein ACQERX_06015 [Bacillota bacterium]